MFSRIVVGFDGSPSAVAALRWASAEAGLHGAELVTYAVLDAPPTRSSSSSAAGSDDSRRLVDSLRDDVERLTAGHPAAFECLEGHTATGLLAACRPQDLLVVGSRGRSPLAAVLLGSVSRACLSAAPCPVAVIRPGEPERHGPARVIVGVDGSENSARALKAAAGEARLRSAVLHAVHAVHWDHLGTELIVPTTEELIAWGRELVTAELARTGVRARPVVLSGHAGDALVRHSAHADLLVLGSRGHNPLAQLLLGSTTEHCARNAACPVLVVR